MKLSGLALSPLLLTALCPLLAQSSKSSSAATHPTATHHKTATSSAAQPCSTLPTLSPKIPALPAGSPCAKPLFTVATVPNIKFDYVSPIASEAGLAETLGMESNKITESYIDSKIGTGPVVTEHKFLTINYTGYLVDGTKFDSSYDRKEPITIPYGQHRVVLGWDTGFEGMHVGGNRRIFIPWQLGYGPNQHDQIPAKSMMIFDLELIAISDSDPTPPRPIPQVRPSPATPPASTPPPVKQPPTTPPATAPVTPPAADPTKPTATPPPATSPKP